MTPALSRSETTSAEASAELEEQEAIAAPTTGESATVAPVSETRILLEGVSWETYDRLLAETGEQRNQRFAYCDGVLEIMVPLVDHEEPTRLFDDFVAVFVDALGLELRKLGSLTMKAEPKAKGLEPDCCFYIRPVVKLRDNS